MNTFIHNKKNYGLAFILVLLLTSFTNAQDDKKKDPDKKDKKAKEVTCILIYKDEDGKTIKVDTTIIGGHFNMESFKKNFDFDFDFNFDMPDLAELNELPEPPMPPMPPTMPRMHSYSYHYGDSKMSAEEKAQLKQEMDKAKEEMEKAREEMKSSSMSTMKKEMDDLKKQMKELKAQMDKIKK
jgi:hypothetical protein